MPKKINEKATLLRQKEEEEGDDNKATIALYVPKKAQEKLPSPSLLHYTKRKRRRPFAKI
jgi:hypothetical protein